jgi:heptosyltransferase-1
VSAVLVIRPSSLGDIVYALAIVSDIRRHRPELAIDWVAERGFAPLLAMCPDIRNVVPFSLRRWREAPFARATWREIGHFRRELRTFRYATVLDLQEQVKGAVIARAARGRRHGFDRASVREPLATLGHDVHHRVARTLHFVDRCRALAGAALGYAIDAPPRWHIVPPPTAPGMPERPFAVLLHATSRPEKVWPEAHWRALALDLARSGFAPLFPWGSPAEEARSRRLAAGIDDAIVPPWLSLPEAATLLAHAEIVVGVDTGFTHLAGALGTSTVGLFFATDPILHGVSSTGAHARDLGGEHGIPGVDEVIVAVGALLRAAPRC